jgi:hypothetical protein
MTSDSVSRGRPELSIFTTHCDASDSIPGKMRGGLKVFIGWLFSISAIFALFVGDVQRCESQTTAPSQDLVCENLQLQIDQLVAVSKAAGLTDEQKMAKLAKSWTDSLAAMNQLSGKDDETTKLVTEMASPLIRIVESALKTTAADGSVSTETKRDFDKLGQLIRPYVSVMKMICPNLALPENVPK